MSREYLIPGKGWISETANRDYLIPGQGWVSEKSGNIPPPPVTNKEWFILRERRRGSR